MNAQFLKTEHDLVEEGLNTNYLMFYDKEAYLRNLVVYSQKTLFGKLLIVMSDNETDNTSLAS